MKIKLLLVDDDENYEMMVKKSLEENGKYEVDAVVNAEAAYEKIKENKYEIILLDVLMPKIEGHEALLEIRKRCNSPVVVVSGYIVPEVKKKIIESGAFACVEKSADMDELIKALEEIENHSK